MFFVFTRRMKRIKCSWKKNILNPMIHNGTLRWTTQQITPQTIMPGRYRQYEKFIRKRFIFRWFRSGEISYHKHFQRKLFTLFSTIIHHSVLRISGVVNTSLGAPKTSLCMKNSIYYIQTKTFWKSGAILNPAKTQTKTNLKSKLNSI